MHDEADESCQLTLASDGCDYRMPNRIDPARAESQRQSIVCLHHSHPGRTRSKLSGISSEYAAGTVQKCSMSQAVTAKCEWLLTHTHRDRLGTFALEGRMRSGWCRKSRVVCRNEITTCVLEAHVTAREPTSVDGGLQTMIACHSPAW